MRRGLALFWSLAFASALLGWLDAALLHQVVADDAQVAMAALSRKRIIGRDVTDVLRSALWQAQGRNAEELVADAALRLQKAERFLESEYARQGVVMDVFFGFWSDAETDAWLDEMARTRAVSKCPRCLDLGLDVASILADGVDGVGVSPDGLHRAALPFVPFGKPVLGAVFGFGPVGGVTAA